MTTDSPGRVAVTVTGRLAALNAAGFLDGTDVVVAKRIARLVGEGEDDAVLALAFAVRAAREGSSALHLDAIARLTPRLPGGDAKDDADEVAEVTAPGDLADLPEPAAWLEAVQRSRLAAAGVLRVEFGLVQLDRYQQDEVLVANWLDRRSPDGLKGVDSGALEQGISGGGLNEAQAAAVRAVAARATTVLTGGPGTGKTWTVAALLRALRFADGSIPRVALAAPTGKAAARMNEALESRLGAGVFDPAVTIHRLLGPLPRTTTRFRHDRANPLPHDVVVVDEASMVGLGLMARLVDALSPETRLLLVGDPEQLASVEAGTVLADLVRGLGPHADVVELTENRRSVPAIQELARAVRSGEPEEVLAILEASHAEVRFIDTDQPTLADLVAVTEQARALRELAIAGDLSAAVARLSEARLLCGRRSGPHGIRRWNRLVEQALTEHAPEVAYQPFYLGRPLMVTRNDHGLGLSNGDTGVVVRGVDGNPLAAILTGQGIQTFSPWRLADVETMHAMTVHKAQGSEANDVTVILPPLISRLLTRELLYTATTRAKARLTVIGSREAIRAAVTTPIERSSALTERLLERAPIRGGTQR
ncbi:exodeoxyribonuclease V subunit alpha [Knoellia sp. CPCC 206450]|uniref:exodeoxyribonuclease V subunit alpha n=1 Tax=Knoellia tibetensis TaxID=3404798 RepID=UPI003B435375